MFYKSTSLYGILTFDKDNYDLIIEKIKESRGYSVYIDPVKKSGVQNPRYKHYLEFKEHVYTLKTTEEKNKTGEGVKAIPDISGDYNSERIEAFLGVHELTEYYNGELHVKIDVRYGSAMYFRANLDERELFEEAMQLNETIEEVKINNIDKDFYKDKLQSFFLLPFLAKIDGEKVFPHVILTVHSIGVATIHITFYTEKPRVETIPDSTPNHIEFDEVYLYQQLSEYRAKDFYEMVEGKNCTIYDVLDYYTSWLENLTGVSLNLQKERQVAWVLGNFEKNTDESRKLDDFIEDNKDYFVSHLTNGSNHYLNSMLNEKKEEFLSTGLLYKYNGMNFYANDAFSILAISQEAFYESAKKHIEKELAEGEEFKKEEYFDKLNELYVLFSLKTMMEFFIFHEYTFVKRFFALELLHKIQEEENFSLNDYNNLKSNLNSLKLRYDGYTIFNAQGSPRQMYEDLLEKTGTNRLIEKVENLLEDVRDEVSRKRELNVKKSETAILVASSLLTVILGYRGIKFIVNDLLANLPFGINSLFTKHPMWWTAGLWALLCLVMFWLNYRRLKITKI